MIELRHLRYFIAVAEELNFKRAAERVHIDQTPLSRTIRDLEDRLGLQLFVRGPRRLHLTPAGTSLLNEARKVFIRIERAYRVVRETDARFQAPLRIGVADGIAQLKLSECFLRWQRLEPAVSLELMEMRASELATALEREEVDAGFSFGIPGSEAIAQHPAWNYPAMALLPKGHELTHRGILSLTEVLAFPLLSFHPRRLPGLAHQVHAIAQRHSSTLTPAGEACSLTGYVTRVASGLAVGIVDAGHLDTLRRTDVVAMPLVEPELVTTYVLHKHQRFGLRHALERFVAAAKDS